MPEYPREVLIARPVVAIELVGTALLGEAEIARGRLEKGADDEALHDFRVSLRRLRSVLRAFRPHVERHVTRKLRRRIRDLARATNEARDAEVQEAWVRARRRSLTPLQRVGAKWWLEHLAERRERAYEVGWREIEREFDSLQRRLRKALGAAALEAPHDGGHAATYAGALASLIATHAATLEQRLQEIHAPQDQEQVHAARIAAKRLRYLLELVAGVSAFADQVLDGLKRLQTVLGELHDLQVADGDLATACEVAAAEHARRLSEAADRIAGDRRARRAVQRLDATPGVLALTRLARQAQLELFAQLETWQRDDVAVLHEQLHELLDLLGGMVPPRVVEVERKYLLSALPAAVAGAAPEEIEQGWLPGTRLLERLRRVRAAEGERYFRTVKLGEGLTRLELEEETTGSIFEHLWPLTEGRRVRKRRHRLPEGDLMWEIDEFLDRELVLAEVELPSPDAEVSLPEWLAPVVVRDVTGEPEYSNVNLAR